MVNLIYRLHNWCNEKHGDDLIEEAQALMSEAAEALAARPEEAARWVKGTEEDARKYICAAPGCTVWFINGDGTIWRYDLPSLPEPQKESGS